MYGRKVLYCKHFFQLKLNFLVFADYELRESVQLDGGVFKPYQRAGRSTAGRSRLAAPFATDASAGAAAALSSSSGASRSGQMALADQLRSAVAVGSAGSSRASAPPEAAASPSAFNGGPRVLNEAQRATATGHEFEYAAARDASVSQSQSQSNQSFKRPPSGRLMPMPMPMQSAGGDGVRRAAANEDMVPVAAPAGHATYRRQPSDERSARPESRGSAAGGGRRRGRPDSASRFSSTATNVYAPGGGGGGARGSSLSRASDRLPNASLVNGTAFPPHPAAPGPAYDPNPNTNANTFGSRGSNSNAAGRARAGVGEPPMQPRGAPPQAYHELFGAPLDSRAVTDSSTAPNSSLKADRNRCVRCSLLIVHCSQLLRYEL